MWLAAALIFLALGLVLAGLAWLNRWAASQQDPREPGYVSGGAASTR